MTPVICAGNYKQAAQWAREHLPDVNPRTLHIASRPEKVMGLARFGTYVIVGTFWGRPDARDIIQYLKAKGFTRISKGE